MMFNITVAEELKERWPQYRGVAVYAEVTNTPYSDGLWAEIADFTEIGRAHV